MNRPMITEFMGDGFTLDKAHKQYLHNLELWNYIQALDVYIDYLEEKLSERQSSTEVNEQHENKALHIANVSNRTFECIKCGGKYELIAGDLRGYCTAEANYRTSGICGGELIETTK